MNLSLIICAHNPRLDFLERVLMALRNQTLPLDQWELILIDNASAEPLATRVDLSWHPRTRVIHEATLGLTAARLRGIREAESDLLVFSDDDTLLASNYLEEALRISSNWPTLGAWGGQLIPEFETEPPEWTKPYWPLIAIGSFENDRWSNQSDPKAVPCGAGLCIRTTVAREYVRALSRSETRKQLDRRGDQLLSGGDIDMALTSCDLGLGTALLSSLRVVHLIPARRLTMEYLLAMREAMSFSAVVLNSYRPHIFPPKTRLRLIADLIRALAKRGINRKFLLASVRGEFMARRAIGKGKNLIDKTDSLDAAQEQII
jgi:glycosyltransferase involved in cell wall biosynthesis